MKPRPYQEEAANAAVREYLAGKQSTLLVMPTGTGKTVVFADLAAKARRGRVMVIAGREELLDQAADKIETMTGHRPDIEQADRRADRDWMRRSSVVVASVQTLATGRMQRFKPEQFSLVVVDEAHHATAPTWIKVLDWFKQNKSVKILGVTATPDRGDKKGLGKVFESVAWSYDFHQAVGDGWLVPIVARSVMVEELDYSSCRTTAGDLNGRDLAELMEREYNLQSVVAPTLELYQGRKTLVFAASVAAAERMCEIFNRHGNLARFVCGKTPKDERRTTITEYQENKFPILVNVGCLTEGFDDPGVRLVVMARATKSRALYAQMVGRGTRPLPGIVDAAGGSAERREAIQVSDKPNVEVLDFVGNAGRHELITPIDILGGDLSDSVKARAKKIVQDSGGIDTAEAIELAKQEEIDEQEEQRKLALAKRQKVVAKAKFTVADPHSTLGVQPSGYQEPASDKQVVFLAKQGIDARGMDKSDASRMIGKIRSRMERGLCTVKQAALLEKHGYRTESMTKEEASRAIDSLAANGWKR